MLKGIQVHSLAEKYNYQIELVLDHLLTIYRYHHLQESSQKLFYRFEHQPNLLLHSHLYNLPTTGLRFFTVYGPWGRPDMALFKFTKAILEGKKIQVFNYGKHRRDFTYIDDIVEGVIRVIDKPAQKNTHWNSDEPDPGTSLAPWRIYNIGNNSPVELLDYIKAIENALGLTAEKEFLPLQAGDVQDTYSDVDDLFKEFDYKPSMSVDLGVENFVNWFKKFYII